MTVLFVTHDIDEAIYLGSHVAVLTQPALVGSKPSLTSTWPAPGASTSLFPVSS